MWDLIVSVPDHCLSFYFEHEKSLGEFQPFNRTQNSKNLTFISLSLSLSNKGICT